MVAPASAAWHWLAEFRAPRGRGSSAAAHALSAVLPAALALCALACSTRDAEPITVSVRDVVTEPYGVDGRLVKLIGLLRVDPDGDALYWHESDAARSAHSHAVAVRLPLSRAERRKLNGKLVIVEGIFKADAPRRPAAFNGAICDVRHVRALLPTTAATPVH